MGKSQTKQLGKDINTQQGNTNKQYSGFDEQNQNNNDQNSGNLNPERADLNSRYADMSAGIGAPKTSNAGNQKLADTGGVDMGALTESLPGYRSIAANGGWDSNARASAQGNINNLSNIGQTGGISDGSMNRMRGLGVYDEFAQNGGYSQGDKANIMAQSLSPIGAYRQNMTDQMATRRSVQGGYAPGFDAAGRALSRDTSRNIADTALNARIGLQDKVNQGRMWGAQGVSGAETNAQQLRTGNMLAGSQGAIQGQMGVTNSIAQNQLAGLGGINQTNQTAQGMRQSGMIAGNNMVNNENQFNAGMDYNTRMAGIGGIQGLYSQDVANTQAGLDRTGNSIGAQAGANQGYFGNQTPIATQPGAWNTGLKLAGGIAGGVGGMMTGMRGMGGARGYTGNSYMNYAQ